ncbi:1-acyl-sn-glycerol-3-phosphate acyltransferase [Chryseobacterium caseinilyticum]|uniref:1-acyl-sn-glycerol-3-phosphate acyltransferase n=1 Tax=Chryseobacterium caseinilyticum TaxID=2771428 RepID=A0ABR8ZC27_9FLAO|nr:1-acyl-sn-glycerol-3-phosphate acyltransferase [Chryseobacterium caseinilyticum]MBD8082803.1 1-acyl-sn-glycerol-3-phosphate acyltransferase [Chryseobacterium caseinilyticum]
MNQFDAIRSYYDNEVNDALKTIADHPMMNSLMQFTFPESKECFWLEEFKKINTVHDFQHQFISKTIRQILKESCEDFTTSGFEKLDKNTSYLYISNHRDIVLDTCLLNLALMDSGCIMTSSAIGDNLVKKDFLQKIAKLNRNFLVRRGLPVRSQLESSTLLSQYICKLLKEDNRSVWIAQKEGRTKDGDDRTNPGVLKMLALNADKEPLYSFFKKLKIVPVSISYELDPTDVLKMPQLIAQSKNEKYIKADNEDFTSILQGVLGQKKRIHLHAGEVLDHELDLLPASQNKNQQLQSIAKIIDHSILKNYKLWPSQFIAKDLLEGKISSSSKYTEEEKNFFLSRLESRIDKSDTALKNNFLLMYAKPLLNMTASPKPNY